MAQRSQRLFLYDEGDPSMRDFVVLSREQLNCLSEFIDEHGYFGDAKELLGLSQKLGVSLEKAQDLVQYAGFLENERARLGLTTDDMIDEFQTYLERHEVSDAKDRLLVIAGSLRRLFSERKAIQLRSKIATVASGIVPQALDFYSLCDLRPVFNEQRDEIVEYVPVALIRVLARNDVQQDVPLIFQIDRNGLSKLEEFLSRLRKKMAKLEEARDRLQERTR